MDYPSSLSYLNSFQDYEKLCDYSYKAAFKLERIANFLNSLGNPQSSFKVIHIAGTKGKGSTASFIAHILKEAGFKTGLYTSPHLSDQRERIRILEKTDFPQDFSGMISEQDFAQLLTELEPKIASFNQSFKKEVLTYFEIITALAFMYFKKEAIDFAVLETGLGGRLDATNVCEPLICAITPLSIEHTQYLGPTLEEIAGEKAGIIKENSYVFSAPQKESAEKVLRRKAAETNSRIYFLGQEIRFEPKFCSLNEQAFDLKALNKEYSDLKINLNGAFQIINANLAVSVVDALKFHQINIDEQAIRTGLLSTRWPARFEIVSSNPLIILDGAQNTHSVGALLDSVKNLFNDKKIILVFGVSNDKDIRGMGELLRDAVDTVILTQAHHPRAANVNRIKEEAGFKAVQTSKTVDEAIKLAKTLIQNEELILITGSLFVCAEARELLKKAKIYAPVK